MRVFLVANLAASLMLIAPSHAGDGDRTGIARLNFNRPQAVFWKPARAI